MKFIKITLSDNDRTAIVIPVEHAGLAASLLAEATVFERDGYYASSGWKPAENGIQIAYCDGEEFAPTHPKVAEAEEAMAKKNSEWYEQYKKRETAERELAETRAALSALQATVTCTVNEPETVTEEPILEEDE